MSNETLVFNGPDCLIEYMRMVRFIELSVGRWGRNVCWGERTFDRLHVLEQEVDAVIFKVFPPATAVWLHAFMGWRDGLRLLCMQENIKSGLITGAKQQLHAVQGKGAKVRWSHDPKSKAMAAIRSKWETSHKPGGSFAMDMARQYQKKGITLTEGGIKNAINRWRKEV